jgi:hypothetical protein
MRTYAKFSQHEASIRPQLKLKDIDIGILFDCQGKVGFEKRS